MYAHHTRALTTPSVGAFVRLLVGTFGTLVRGAVTLVSGSTTDVLRTVVLAVGPTDTGTVCVVPVAALDDVIASVVGTGNDAGVGAAVDAVVVMAGVSVVGTGVGAIVVAIVVASVVVASVDVVDSGHTCGLVTARHVAVALGVPVCRPQKLCCAMHAEYDAEQLC
jgi:hypothetical protein